jgi:hypothetical protein
MITYDELGREVGGDGARDEVLSRRRDGALADLVQESSTEVGREQNDGVLEVDDATLAVSETALVEDLEEDHHEFAGGFPMGGKRMGVEAVSLRPEKRD